MLLAAPLVDLLLPACCPVRPVGSHRSPYFVISPISPKTIPTKIKIENCYEIRNCGRLADAVCFGSKSEFFGLQSHPAAGTGEQDSSETPRSAWNKRLSLLDSVRRQWGALVDLNGGHKLRALREALGCTMRDVETASLQIARRLSNEEFTVPPSRLSDIETKGVIPSIFRLYSLAAIYKRDYRELLSWYGVELNKIHLDIGAAQPTTSHVTTAPENVNDVHMPVKLDPAFAAEKTTNFGRMIEKWGIVPLSYLSALVADERYTYGYIGTEDLTMYPILPPGSFIQVDETKNKVAEGVWRSEFERPIYFVETRDGYVCSWCNVRRDTIVLQPHPLSPASVRVLRHPQEAEVIGQVVGVAMRLGEWQVFGSPREPKERAALP